MERGHRRFHSVGIYPPFIGFPQPPLTPVASLRWPDCGDLRSCLLVSLGILFLRIMAGLGLSDEARSSRERSQGGVTGAYKGKERRDGSIIRKF